MRHRGDSDDNICSGKIWWFRPGKKILAGQRRKREKALYSKYPTLRYRHFVVLLPLIRNGAIGKDGSQHPESKRPRHDDDDRNARRSGSRLGLRDALICGGAKALASSPAARETMQ